MEIEDKDVLREYNSMITELSELNRRITKIRGQIEANYKTTSDSMLMSMIDQEKAMSLYASALHRRIDILKEQHDEARAERHDVRVKVINSAREGAARTDKLRLSEDEVAQLMSFVKRVMNGL